MEGGRIVQCGTPQEIFRAPATEYVAEFVAHMNPLGVLVAEDVMGPRQDAPTARQVEARAPLSEVMVLMAAQAHPVLVTRNGAPVGEITAEGVFARLLNPGA